MRWAWLAAAVVPLLIAAYMLMGSADSDRGAAAVAEAAGLNDLLLRVAAAADGAAASGDLTALQAATVDLDANLQAISSDVAIVLGPVQASERVAVLQETVTALSESALAYASGSGEAGAGGPAFTAASEQVDALVAQLVAQTELSAQSIRATTVRVTGLVLLAAALASMSLLRSDRRVGQLRRSGDASRLRLDELARDLPDMVYETDADARLTFVSEASKRLVGFFPDDMVGRLLEEFTSMPALPDVDASDASDAAGGAIDDVMVIDGDWIGLDGVGRPLSTVARAVRSEAGDVIATRGVVRDNRERVEAEQALRASEERFRAVLNTTQNGLMIVGPDGRLILHNQVLADILGYDAEEFADLTVGQLVLPEALESISALLTARMWSDAAPTRNQIQMVRRDGEVLDIDLSVATFRQADENIGVLVEVRDLTESKRASETIRRMADYDGLTGLPNRTLFDRYIQQALGDAERLGRVVAVLMVDLDRFKLINDTLGHPSGDRLLKAVAKRLSAHLSPRHTLARFGGDEFLVLIPDLDDREAAESVGRSVVDSFAADFDHEGRELNVAGSVGVSVYPDHGDTADALISHAGAAMYQAKAVGGNGYAVYEPDLDGPAQDRLSLETELNHALDRSEFVLHYQPLVDIASGEIVGAEALMRWQHPTRGEVQPLDFVPLLEDTGLIVPAGEWVLRTACAQAKQWHDEGLTKLHMAVNLSARQFLEPNLSSIVASALEDSGLDPAFLDLEVTETTAMQNTEAAIQVLRDLREMGVRTSLDDFGIGHSSLGRLKQFPIDTLKIDRSFVSSASESSDDLAIVRGIIALGHAMGLRIVAEGVETDAQLAVLQHLECDVAQGFLYSQPIVAESFSELLATGVTAEDAA